MQEFTGKVAIVTGAARGIGRATAARLARDGAAVMLVDVDAVALEVVADNLGEAGLAVAAAQADVSDGGAVRAVVERTAETLDGVDVLSTARASSATARSWRPARSCGPRCWR